MKPLKENVQTERDIERRVKGIGGGGEEGGGSLFHNTGTLDKREQQVTLKRGVTEGR